VERRIDAIRPRGIHAAIEEKRIDILKPPKKKAMAIFDNVVVKNPVSNLFLRMDDSKGLEESA
jgi:hypothetical protein